MPSVTKLPAPALLLVTALQAQVLQAQVPPARLTLAQVVEAATRNYPSIHVSQEQLAAAAAGIRLARTAYLPRLDAVAQVNRATRNNVFGLLLPQSVIPSISGPVLGTNNPDSVWGSAIGTLITWEPFDFGFRQASVATAEAARKQSAATLKRTEFEVAVAAADSCLTLAAAEETVRAAQAAVDRAQVTFRTTTALANAQLRPGADASRAEAEMAATRTQFIQAQQAVDVARALVAQFLGTDPAQLAIAPPGQIQPASAPGTLDPGFPDPANNPIAIEQAATVEQAQAQLRALERSWFPRFALQGSLYARGTGAVTNGTVTTNTSLGGLNGLGPSVQNYALGFSVTFPLLDLPATRAREAVQSANVRAQMARAEQIKTELRTRWNVAVANLHGATQIASNLPTQVSAARTALQQASARYEAGLGTIDQVAEAQRLLTQAEIDGALSRLGIWRALLGIAAAAGDIQPFVTEASRTGASR